MPKDRGEAAGTPVTDLQFWTPDRKKIAIELGLAIERGQATNVRRLCSSHPWLIRDYSWDDESTWIGIAAQQGNREMVATMLDLGFNINALGLPEKSSVLFDAICFEHWDLLPFLLDKGANPNLDRPLISAANIRDPARRLSVVKLLVERGADVNRIYEIYDDPNDLTTALDWAGDDAPIASYLQSQGAKTLEELKAAKKQ